MSNANLLRTLDPAAHKPPAQNPSKPEPSRLDPLDLMEIAARAHWRAAAWLLERTRPEEYGRKSASAAPRRQVEAALLHVLEAALDATPLDQRDAVDERVFAACQRAFASCFPAVAALAPLKPPAELSPTLSPPAAAQLSPKTCEATEDAARQEWNHDGTTSTTECDAEVDPPPSNGVAACSALPEEIVSPKIANATEGPATELPAVAEDLSAMSPMIPAAESQLLSLQRHAALRRREQLQSRKRQAAAKRQKKAAKKQARAARRRAA